MFSCGNPEPCPALVQTNLYDILMSTNLQYWNVCNPGIFPVFTKAEINSIEMWKAKMHNFSMVSLWIEVSTRK